MTARRTDIDDEQVRFMNEVEGMSQQDIADYYGVNQPTIYYILNPEKNRERGKQWYLEHLEYHNNL